MHSRRALLYVPGDDLHKIQKATGLNADCVCLDLEDGVALNRKDAARGIIRAALQDLDFSGSERLVRINPLNSERGKADLDAVLPARPDGIVLTKVQSAIEVRWMDGLLSRSEADQGLQLNSLALIVLIENARAFLDLKEICAATSRLQALIFGAEDFTDDIGAIRTPDRRELFTARSLLVIHTAAFGLQAIDMVTVEFRDLEIVQREARTGAALGYSGKQVIHPNQVATVQDAFTPSDVEIERARALLEAFEQHQQRGTGAFAIDGKMVDMPIIRQAENLLARARAAGKEV